jgi:hypothetical protein
MTLNRSSEPSLLRKRGGKIAAKNSGSFTHKNLHTEPSFMKLNASYEATGEGLPHQYNPKIKPSKARKFSKGNGAQTPKQRFNDPLDYGPNNQRTLAKRYFSNGGSTAIPRRGPRGG